MLNTFESMEQKVDRKSSKENILQNEIDQLLEVCFTSEIRDCVLLSIEKQKNELLKDELAKSSSDSKDIQANLLKRIKILENDFKRSQAQTTRTQHQKEVNELIEHVNQKTYAYADMRAQSQTLLMTISELKDRLRTNEKGKHVNTKFDKYETLGKLVCVTPFNKNLGNKAKNVSNTKVKTDRSKPVASHPTPKSEKSVESSNSVRRPKSKGTKSKNRVLKNTKSSSAYVRKISRSVSIDSNNCETKDSNVCQTNESVSNSKSVNVVNDDSNIVCVSYGKDVFLLSYEKCVAHYALSSNSNFKRALFTTPVAAKSKNLGTTYVVAKSRLSVANTPKAINKVIQLVLWIVDSGCSKQMTGNLQLLRNFIEKFMGIVRFENNHFATITGYGDYVQGNLTILCLMSRATSTKSWLWHRGLSHLNFGTINQLTLKDLVDGLPKYKYNKDHLCSACEQGKSKKASLLPKLVPSTESKLELLHMDLCGPMKVLGIVHQTSIARMPQQNGVVEHRNRALVEAARTMLIFSKALEFLWAEAIATPCFT
ncbi:retrovirus-related pol polyprotein from transposon TNT 1-94 [Tanacetum coccineum]